MRRIILASKSSARKELLKLFGFRFKVICPRLKEKRRLKISCPSLVKDNALHKAQEVAKKMDSGIVIAADTIVSQGNKIFGKPKNLNSATAMLKKLSSRPHWIYTGIAMIDVDKKKTRVDYEKTKIFMQKLTRKDIDKYVSEVKPYNFAGSFDIQGKGGFFIKRIEGCFYNVVGLPLAKLYQMFKKAGIKLILVFSLGFLAFSLVGCTTEYNIATKKEEWIYYNTDREQKIGQSISEFIEKKYKLNPDPLIQKRVSDIGEKIANASDRKDIKYSFKVIEEKEINAVSLPGGFIYCFQGLIDNVADDDELACVLAHEVGHIVAKHSIKKLQGLMGYMLLRIATSQIPQTQELGQGIDLAFEQILLGYSREDEFLADRLGVRYALKAGFDPRAMISFLKKLRQINLTKPPRSKSYARTHPYILDRIRIVKQELGEKMDFKDYINIEEGNP